MFIIIKDKKTAILSVISVIFISAFVSAMHSYNKAENEVDSMRKEILELDSEIESKSETIGELESEIDTEKKKVDELEVEIETKNQDIENKDSTIQELRDENLKNKSKIKKLEESKSNNDVSVSRSNSYKGKNGNAVSNPQSVTYTATAYTAYCNGCSGVTKEGIDLRANPNSKVIAVDPSRIPLGSLVEVTSSSYPSVNGRYIAGDTGGAIKGNKIDIFIPSKTTAYEFGRRDVQVKIIRSGW